MAEDDKIKYSDIIEPDDSIEKLVKQLGELNQSYETMVNAIRAGADRIVHSLKSASGATSEGRKAIDEATVSTSRLERAQNELKLALSDTGRQIAWLKAQTSDANKATVEQQRYIQQAISSYDRLKSDLKQTVELYKSLTAAERADSEMGQQLLNDILNLKNQIKALDDQMKPHIQTLSEVEKAEQRLAYLQSDEGKRLIELKAKIAELTSARKQQKATVDPLTQAQEKLAYAQSEENKQLKLYSTQIREANQIAQLQATIANSAEGSYNRLSAQYALNKIRLNQMSAAEREAADSGKKLETETNAIYQQMIKLQEATGNYRLSVGHYQKTWDGLGISISQVVRELPAAAVSLNTFFLGISNNIPVVVDEIKRLRRQNELLAAEGKKQISVTGSIVKALFGWNTALVVLLTVFSMYGKEIITWIDKTLAGRDAAKSFEDALEDLNSELGKGSTGAYGQQIAVLRRLSENWRDLGDNVKAQTQWIKDNEKEFGKLGITIDNINDANNAFVENTESVVAAYKARAKAEAALNIVSQQYQKLLAAENKAEAEKVREYGFFDKTMNYFKALWGGISGPDSDLSLETRLKKQRQRNVESLQKDAKSLEQEVESYFNVWKFYEDQADALFKEIGLEESHKKDKKRTPRDADDRLNTLALAAEKAYQKSRTEIERDENKKRRAEAFASFNQEIADLNDKYARIQKILKGQDEKYKELTESQKETAIKALEDIENAIENKQKGLTLSLDLLNIDVEIQKAEQLLELLELEGEVSKKGSYEELSNSLKRLDVERQIALLKNAQLPEAKRQPTSAINASFDKQKAIAVGSFSMSSFDEQQALDEAIFNEVKRSETEIARFKLEQEKARWQEQIRLAEAGGLDWSQAQIDAAKATVKGIDRELSELNDFIKNIGKKGLGGTLLEKLGFDDDQVDALKDAVNIVIEQLQSIVDAEVEMSKQIVEAAEARVEAAQKAYDAEIEARNNGYANNVATARKELEQEKKNQQEKQKMLEAAQRRQESLNSITQASSLITASANLWSSFSSIPIVGPALALAAIATMWTSFATAKVKAKQVTASQSDEYGEGGLEFLEGGSHASGNDIDLGVKNKKKHRMKAEGGEALAIINKNKTRKYRKILPDVINSLNKGIFEDKYANAFNRDADADIFINQSNADLHKIESSLDKIIKQNGEKIFVDGQGRTIIRNGNLTKIIRS
jgi:DNA repair exonuclease SbcCD ATPase subunit|nr:MAG TPA: tail length tape measure protein [Caudoviricetes sp.]